MNKLFEGIKAINHAVCETSKRQRLSINNDEFNSDSIIQILEHINYIKSFSLSDTQLKIIINTPKVTDDAILLIFESIIYYVLKHEICEISYTFVLNKQLIGYKMFKMSNLYKYNTKVIDKDSFIMDYEQDYVFKKHYRKVCKYSFENVYNEYLSVILTDISSFFKNCNIYEKYADDLSEAIAEIIGNALEHSNDNCILDIKVLYDDYKKYKFINVTTLSIGDVFVGNKIINYVENPNNNCYNSSNQIVLDAYNNHKSKFDELYDLSSFALVSAFQKYVTTRFDSVSSGGTGLTTLIQQLIDKSDGDYCYLLTGDNVIYFKDEYLKLTDDGLIGFNKSNDYIEQPPSDDVVKKVKNKLNVTIYSLQFMLKEDEPMNRIELDFNKTITGLAGNLYGVTEYNKQAKDKFDWNGMNEIIFPNHITKVSISFVQGFFKEILEKINKEDIDDYVTIKTSADELTEKIIGNIKF